MRRPRERACEPSKAAARSAGCAAPPGRARRRIAHEHCSMHRSCSYEVASRPSPFRLRRAPPTGDWTLSLSSRRWPGGGQLLVTFDFECLPRRF
eukprot:2784048-Prymnesium_polylepis.2